MHIKPTHEAISSQESLREMWISLRLMPCTIADLTYDISLARVLRIFTGNQYRAFFDHSSGEVILKLPKLVDQSYERHSSRLSDFIFHMKNRIA